MHGRFSCFRLVHLIITRIPCGDIYDSLPIRRRISSRARIPLGARSIARTELVRVSTADRSPSSGPGEGSNAGDGGCDDDEIRLDEQPPVVVHRRRGRVSLGGCEYLGLDGFDDGSAHGTGKCLGLAYTA